MREQINGKSVYSRIVKMIVGAFCGVKEETIQEQMWFKK